MSRAIVHMDLDTFFVSVERLKDSSLNGRPLIVGGSSRRGVVAACSYETRVYGVRSAMPIRMALTLCPDALVISGDTEAYSQYSHMVTEIIREQAPLFEKTSIDEFYLDLTGMDKFFGAYKWTTELRRYITKETGLPISFGLSSNKTVSKMGTNEIKPNNQIHLFKDEEKSFIAPLSVGKIPMIGEKTFQILSSMGIRTVKTLSNIDPELLQRQFGKNGLSLWEKANAIDNTPVIGYSERKSISTEQTFLEDTTDVYFLRSLIVGMTEKIAFELRQSQKLTSCITVKIRYSDFNTTTLQARIPYTSCDHILIEKAKELFDKLYNRRLLIRLIGVRLSSLVQGCHQINLFDDTEEMINLYLAMDRMKNRFGKKAVGRAVSFDSMVRQE